MNRFKLVSVITVISMAVILANHNANASSIIESIGADPFTFPTAPIPTIVFSPNPNEQIQEKPTTPSNESSGNTSSLELGNETFPFQVVFINTTVFDENGSTTGSEVMTRYFAENYKFYVYLGSIGKLANFFAFLDSEAYAETMTAMMDGEIELNEAEAEIASQLIANGLGPIASTIVIKTY